MMEPFSATAQTFAPSFLKFRQAKVDYVLFWNWSVKIGVRYFKEAKKYLPNTPTVGVHWTAMTLYFYLCGQDFDNHYVVCGFPTEQEMDNEFVKIAVGMAKKNKHDVKAWTGYFQSFAMAQLAADAARKVVADGKPLTRDNARDALENNKTTLLGMFGGKDLDYSTHKFSRARVLRADWSTKSLVPMTDWVNIYEYLK